MTGILRTYIEEIVTPVKDKLKTRKVLRTEQNNDDALFDIKVNNVIGNDSLLCQDPKRITI
jgi:hypothetical protein